MKLIQNINYRIRNIGGSTTFVQSSLYESFTFFLRPSCALTFSAVKNIQVSVGHPTLKVSPRLRPRLTSDSVHSSVYIHYPDTISRGCLPCPSAASDKYVWSLSTLQNSRLGPYWMLVANNYEPIRISLCLGGMQINWVFGHFQQLDSYIKVYVLEYQSYVSTYEPKIVTYVACKVSIPLFLNTKNGSNQFRHLLLMGNQS